MLMARQLYAIRDTKYEMRAFTAIATCLPAEGLICWISTADWEFNVIGTAVRTGKAEDGEI